MVVSGFNLTRDTSKFEYYVFFLVSFILKTGGVPFRCSDELRYSVLLLDDSLTVGLRNKWPAMTDLVCSQSNCTKPLRVTVD